MPLLCSEKVFRIDHVSTNSARQPHYQRDRMVDTSGLSNILRVDTPTKTALVEPNVPMDALVEAILQHDLIPPVAMGFPGSTMGGDMLAGVGS